MAQADLGFVVKFIRPEFLSSNVIRGHLLATCQKYIRKILKDWREITNTWEQSDRLWGGQFQQAVFEHQIRYAGGNIIAKVYTEDEIVRYLDQGTDIRWAVMSNPFTPKTTPGWIGSRAGQGGAVIRGQTAMQKRNIAPRPGIKARRWTQAISVKHQADFSKDIEFIITQIYTGTTTTGIVP